MLGVPFGTRRAGYALCTRTACGVLAILMLAVSGCQSVVTRAQSPSPFVSRPGEDLPVDESFDDRLSQIVVEGNTTIPSSAILDKIKTQAGRVADQKQIKEDIRTLYATRWFFSVEPRYRQSNFRMWIWKKSNGYVS